MNKKELQAEMKRKGFTYEQVSKSIGISYNAFWRKVNNQNEFTLSEIQSLVKILDMDKSKISDIFFDQ